MSGAFGPYELLGLIGRGGMGEVYRARDTRKGRTVALKVLPAALSSNPHFRTRFQREARIAANLNNPYVVPIHDYGAVDGVLYIDMALVEGSDLRAQLRSGPLPPDRVISLCSGIASALDAAHAQGLLHRDVKPENILVTHEGFAYLTDFGIAAHEDDTRLTGTGTALGSLRYMAPERFDDGDLTAAVDEYALACVMYECLGGRPPFDRTTASAMVRAHLMDQPPSLRDTGLPFAADAVIRRGLAKEPGERFADCQALVEALSRSLHGWVDGRALGVTLDHDADSVRRDADRSAAATPTEAARHNQQTGAQDGPRTGDWDGHAPAVPPARAAGSAGRSRKPVIAGVIAIALAVALLAGYLQFGRDKPASEATNSTIAATGAPPSGTQAPGSDTPRATHAQSSSGSPAVPGAATSSDPSGASASTSWTSRSAAAAASSGQQQPIASVRVGNDGAHSMTSLQTFTNDLTAGRLDVMVRRCWTTAPSRLQATYDAAGRALFARVVTTTPRSTERGLSWMQGNASIFVSWPELQSPYACPRFETPSTPRFPSIDDAIYLMKRLDGRIAGTPVNRGDNAHDYPLLCDTVRLDGVTSEYPGTTDAAFIPRRLQLSVRTLATAAVEFLPSGPQAAILRAAGGHPQATLLVYGDLCLDSLAH